MTPPDRPDGPEGAPPQAGDPADDDAGLRRRLEQFIPDMVRRALLAGSLPKDMAKDVANFVLAQAANSKDEILRVVAKEVRGFLESANLSAELQKLLTQLSLEVKTEVRFIPNDEAVGGVKPDMKREFKLKRSGKEVKEE